MKALRGLNLMLAAAALAAGAFSPLIGGATAVDKMAPPSKLEQRRRRSAIGSGTRYGGQASYPKNSGWTDARYRRAAAKKRNRARHRAACRGSN